MYVVTSTWKFGSPGQAVEAIRRFRDDFGPLVRARPGLRQWYLVSTGADEAVTISVWESRAAYETAQPSLASWVQEHLADMAARVQYRRRGDIAGVEVV